MIKNSTFPAIDDVKAEIRFEEEKGSIWLHDQRMLLMHSTSFAALRDELCQALGLIRAKGLMWRIGYAAGRSDAQLARKIRPDATDEEAFAVGPQLHSLEGVVHVELIKMEMDISSGHFYGEFYWDNSFEADEYLKNHGIHTEPVCWLQLGYAAGYTSEFMKVEVFYKELDCVGCGDDRCRIKGKPLAKWDDVDDLKKFYALDQVAETLFSLTNEVQELRSAIGSIGQPEDIVSESKVILEIMELLGKAAQSDVSVLMLGETGVGKDVFSNYLHRIGSRSKAPFIVVNCAALPKDLIESELFGVEKGAFTGADKSRAGRFERAHKGTLFLDEIGELSKQSQAKLLRVLQTGEFERVGDTRTRKVNVRIIAATNASLQEKVSQGEFRADLFYRLNVFPIFIPPLRERPEDIPGLALKFVSKYAIKHNKRIMGISKDLMQKLVIYSWPGNIRELQNLIERGVILTDNDEKISSPSLGAGLQGTISVSQALGGGDQLSPLVNSKMDPVDAVITSGMGFEDLEKQILEKTLSQAKGNVARAARILGMTAPQYRYRLKKYNLNLEEG